MQYLLVLDSDDTKNGSIQKKGSDITRIGNTDK